MFSSSIHGRSGSPLPAERESVAHPPIDEAIRRSDWPAVRSICAAGMPAEAWPAAVVEAFRHRSCPPDIREALLAHPSADFRRALDLAVVHDAVDLARALVARGCMPAREHLRNGSHAMRGVLLHPLEKRILYPVDTSAGTSAMRYTRLDHALLADDLEAASRILRREARGETPAAQWSNAADRKRADIQRALFLCGELDGDREYRLLEDSGKVTDPGIREMMKLRPYQSPKRPIVFNWNGVAQTNGVVCRHLAEGRQARQALHPFLKSDYTDFRTPEIIKDRISASDQAVRNMCNLATELHLVENRKFGAFIARQFESMKVGTHRQFLVNSTNHAMSLELRIKKDKKDARRVVYVARVYDPNATTTHVRMAARRLEFFEAQDIAAYIGPQSSTDYYQGQGHSMVLVRPPEKVLRKHAGRTTSVPADRRLASGLDSPDAVNVTPVLVYYLLEYGLARDLLGLEASIAGRPRSMRAEVLTARHPYKGVPGLRRALYEGHAAAIRAFGKLVFSEKIGLSAAERVALLEARVGAEDAPGLYWALCNRQAQAVRAYGALLFRLLATSDSSAHAMLTPSRWFSLLAARDRHGVPGLLLAWHAGDWDSIHAFGTLLAWLRDPAIPIPISQAQLVELLAARMRDGTPGLFMALQAGKIGAVLAAGAVFADPRLRLSGDEIVQLLEARRESDGTPGLFMALQAGHAATVRAFGRMLAELGGRDHLLSRAQCIDLLAAREPDGMPGLYMALQQGRAEAVAAFGSVLADFGDWDMPLSGEEIFQLLAARLESDGTSGLFVALRTGKTEAVRAFCGVVADQKIPLAAQQRAELLAARGPGGASGLEIALRFRHADAIRVYGKFLLDLPADQLCELLARGARSLGAVLRTGDAGAIAAATAYSDLCRAAVPRLSVQQRAALLEKIRASHGTHLLRAPGLRLWTNYPYYSLLKRRQPGFYSHFKAMKEALRAVSVSNASASASG